MDYIHILMPPHLFPRIIPPPRFSPISVEQQGDHIRIFCIQIQKVCVFLKFLDLNPKTSPTSIVFASESKKSAKNRARFAPDAVLSAIVFLRS